MESTDQGTMVDQNEPDHGLSKSDQRELTGKSDNQSGV